MTYDEVKKAVQAIVAQPENAAVLADSFLESLGADYTAFGSLEADLKAKDEKIRALQDTNTKLFLKVTGGAVKEEEAPLEGKDKADAFWAKFSKED